MNFKFIVPVLLLILPSLSFAEYGVLGQSRVVVLETENKKDLKTTECFFETPEAYLENCKGIYEEGSWNRGEYLKPDTYGMLVKYSISGKVVGVYDSNNKEVDETLTVSGTRFFEASVGVAARMPGLFWDHYYSNCAQYRVVLTTDYEMITQETVEEYSEGYFRAGFKNAIGRYPEDMNIVGQKPKNIHYRVDAVQCVDRL